MVCAFNDSWLVVLVHEAYDILTPTVQCTFYIVQCTLYTVHCTCSVVDWVNNVQCTMYIVHSVYNTKYTRYNVQGILYSVHDILYNVHGILYNVHGILFMVIVHSTWTLFSDNCRIPVVIFILNWTTIKILLCIT